MRYHNRLILEVRSHFFNKKSHCQNEHARHFLIFLERRGCVRLIREHTVPNTMHTLCSHNVTRSLIQEPQHPEGELGTVGHIPIIGEDVGVFHSSYLREILAATANLEGIFPIHLEIALCLSVFHVI